MLDQINMQRCISPNPGYQRTLNGLPLAVAVTASAVPRGSAICRGSRHDKLRLIGLRSLELHDSSACDRRSMNLIEIEFGVQRFPDVTLLVRLCLDTRNPDRRVELDGQEVMEECRRSKRLHPSSLLIFLFSTVSW
jgi:hypothetical protein